MKSKFYFILILLIFSNINAQKREILAVIVNQKNDTIKTNIILTVNLFDNTLIKELSIIKDVKIIGSNGKKIKIPAKDIKRLNFTDLKEKKRSFTYDGKKQLQEIIYDGKIKAFYTYSANPYDGSTISHIDFYDENGDRVKTGPLKTSKSALKKVVKENPELIKIIDESKLTHEETIILVLTKYEEEYLNK